jgi:2,4-dienoyl-CoA reductase-like NADH-dependent reductase (Old Yellow Enzyme family)
MLLFTPIKVGRLDIKNRVVMTPMVHGLASEDGRVTDKLKERYRRIAKGGVGWIISEAAVIQPSKSPYNLRISDDSFLPGLRELVNVVHDENVPLGIQIVHFLKISRSGWRQKVEDFSKEDLKVIVKQHVEAAERAKSAGFDSLEIHMAHAFTLASFLSLRNKRTDEYGGLSLENRMRLPMEVYTAVRDTLGKDFPIGIRINADEFIIGGNTLLQSREIAKRFAEMGVDYISISLGSKFEDAKPPEPGFPPEPYSGYSGHRFAPRWWMPEGANVYLAEDIRKHLRKEGLTTPIITAGKISSPEFAEEVLREGKADLIGMARQLLCDPDWPLKVKAEKWNEIVRCMYCGYCMDLDARYEAVKCIQWPEGLENAPTPFTPKQANAKKAAEYIRKQYESF